MAFGEVLRGLREAAGLTQEVLAHRADLNRNYIGLLERGERSPTIDTVVAIAQALKLPAHQLVRRAEERLG